MDTDITPAHLAVHPIWYNSPFLAGLVRCKIQSYNRRKYPACPSHQTSQGRGWDGGNGMAGMEWRGYSLKSPTNAFGHLFTSALWGESASETRHRGAPPMPRPQTTGKPTHLLEDRGQNVRLVLGAINPFQLRQPDKVGAHQQPEVFSLSLFALLVLGRTLLLVLSCQDKTKKERTPTRKGNFETKCSLGARNTSSSRSSSTPKKTYNSNEARHAAPEQPPKK